MSIASGSVLVRVDVPNNKSVLGENNIFSVKIPEESFIGLALPKQLY